MADTVADRRLHASTLFTRFLRKAPEFVLGLPAVIGFASDANFRKIMLIALAGAAISFVASLLAWLRFRYGVGERDIVIEQGVLHRQRRIIPFDRVQDIDIEQGLLARLFGTAKVRIETGGAGKDEGSLDAVALSEAHRLRDVIRRAAHASAEPGTGPIEAETSEPPLFEMSMPRLLLAGLFNFSLIYLAVIAGMLQYAQPFLERNSADLKQWIDPARDTASGFGLGLTLALLALLILLGIVTGMLRTIARDYRFRLTRSPAGFRRRRGLFTLSEAVIPLRRVQLAIIGSGWLRKPLGWFSLDFQTLGAEAQQSGYQPAAPFARMEEILPILSEAGIAELPAAASYVRVSRLAIARRCVQSLVPLALVALAVAPFWPLALLALPPLILLAMIVVLQWRRHRYALSDRGLYIAEGVLRHRLWIMPFEKAQTITVTRSLLQRRLGLASLTVDTAGATLLNYPVISDVDERTAETLADRLLQEYRRARSLSRSGASPVEMIDPVDECAADPALREERDRDQAEHP